MIVTTDDTGYIAQTIIDGNQNGSVVTFSGEEDSTAVLAGFVITDGNGNYADPDGHLWEIAFNPHFRIE